MIGRGRSSTRGAISVDQEQLAFGHESQAIFDDDAIIALSAVVILLKVVFSKLRFGGVQLAEFGPENLELVRSQ